MANQATQFRITATVEGLERVEALKQSVRLLEAQTKPAAKEIDELRIKALALGTSAEASTRDIKNAVQSLTALKDVTAVSSDRYRQLGRDIQLVQDRYNAATGSIRQFAQAQNSVRNPFTLTGTRGRVTPPPGAGPAYEGGQLGPQELNYAKVEAALQLELDAISNYQTAKNKLRQIGLEKDAALNQLEIDQLDAAEKKRAAASNAAFQAQLKQFDDQRAARARAKERFAKFGQTAGAIAAGGVFGGPEGLIGGAIGAFTPVGALGGAAIGAQVNMFRQSLTSAGDYASEVQRLRIALKGVSTDQKEFLNSLNFINESSSRYLLNLKDTTANYTKLQSAVRGSGLQAKDTQTIFSGLSSAIVASGGGTEQLNGAMLAATQVLSKGKVSAEELLQIAERLPGTYTLFAQAVGKTPQEIAKALKDGKVTTEDFIKFNEALFKRYGQSAKIIGDSPYAAGERLKLALSNLQLATGQALLPMTSLFADFGAKAANALTAAVEGQTAWQKSIDATFEKIRKLVGGITGIQQAVAGLIKGLIVLGGVQAGVFVASNLNTFSLALRGIITFTRELLTVEKALLAIESARAAFQAILAGLTTGATKGKVAGAIFGGVAGVGLAVGLSKIVDEITKNVLNSVNDAFKGLKIDTTIGKYGGSQPPLPGAGNGIDPEAAKQANKDASELNQILQERIRIQIESGKIGADKLSQLALEESLLKELTRAQIEAATLKATNERNRQEEIINIQQIFEKETKRIAEERKNTLKDIDDIGKQVDQLGRKFFERPTKEDDAFTQAVKKAKLEVADLQDQLQKALDTLVGEKGGNSPATKAVRNAIAALKIKTSGDYVYDRASQDTLGGDIQSLTKQREAFRSNGRELTELEKLKQKYLGHWDELDPKLRAQAEALAMQVDHLRQMQEISDSIANSLGGGLTRVFDGLIEGTQNWGNSLREIASTVLKDIAKQLIKILVIDQAINAFKSIFNFGGGGGAAASAGTVFAANGMVAYNGIQPFANGGIVTSPTLFKFASGGMMRNGLMGEAGPEAIIPLQRGANGKLGVAGGGGTTNVVVNVDAKGTNVQGDNNQGAALGRVVSQAVQAELIKQQRPGGLLAA